MNTTHYLYLTMQYPHGPARYKLRNWELLKPNYTSPCYAGEYALIASHGRRLHKPQYCGEGHFPLSEIISIRKRKINTK